MHMYSPSPPTQCTILKIGSNSSICESSLSKWICRTYTEVKLKTIPSEGVNINAGHSKYTVIGSGVKLRLIFWSQENGKTKPKEEFIQPLEFYYTKAFTQQNWTWVLTSKTLTKVINRVCAWAIKRQNRLYASKWMLSQICHNTT